MLSETFFRKELPGLLKQLDPETKPQWGMMTAQHMVEHLVGGWRISNGKTEVKLAIPEAKLETSRKFLFSDKAFKQNVKNPVFPENETLPLRKKSLEDAIQQLTNEIEDFFKHYEEQPSALHTHPIFGELDKKGWLTFQTKHITHHLKQFGLSIGG